VEALRGRARRQIGVAIAVVVPLHVPSVPWCALMRVFQLGPS